MNKSRKKYLGLFAACCVLFINCHKENAAPKIPANTKLLCGKANFILQYVGWSFESDTLIYDASERLSRIEQHLHDSIFGQISDMDLLCSLYYNSGDSLPYLMNSYSPISRLQVDHQLSYDNQSRIVKDSSKEGFVYSFDYRDGYVVVFSYNPQLSFGTSGLSETLISDTLVLEGADLKNYKESYYNPPSLSGIPSPNNEMDYTYGSYQNPYYKEKWSHSLGPLLWMIFKGHSIIDFISPAIRTSWDSHGPTPDPFVYTWKTDSLGRVASGSGLIRSNPARVNYNYAFIYQ